jgi:hypothetical protein
MKLTASFLKFTWYKTISTDLLPSHSVKDPFTPGYRTAAYHLHMPHCELCCWVPIDNLYPGRRKFAI